MVQFRRDYRREIEELRRCEKVLSLEFILRLVLILICATAGYILLDLTIVIPWFFAYYSLITLEKTLLYKYPNGDSAEFFILLLVVSFVNASVFVSLPVYFWYAHPDIYKFGSLAMIVGATLNIFVVRARVWQILMAYLMPIAAGFIIMSFSYYLEEGFSNGFIAALILGTCVAVYLTLAGWEAYSTHQQHEQTTARLHQAQKMEAIGNLTGGIAHDFNNLLSVVMGNLDLLRNQTGHRAESELLIDRAIQAVQRSSKLTSQLLAFGRRSNLMPELLNIGDVLSGIRDLIQRVLPASIELHVDSGGNDLQIFADQNKLETALLNLAINSRDAMPDGGYLSISARKLEVDGFVPTLNGSLEKGDYIEIRVEDSGEGIETGIQQQVFEPFFSTKPMEQGSGLGLSMVLGFVEQSGGALYLFSRPNAGTRIQLYLPARLQESREILTPNNRQIKSGKKYRILVVEDEAELLELLLNMLSSHGHTVRAASDATIALGIIDHGFTPDIVLTDVSMPGRDQGPQLAQKIADKLPQTRFIFMSGYFASVSTSEEIDAQGVILQKPFDMEELFDKVNAL